MKSNRRTLRESGERSGGGNSGLSHSHPTPILGLYLRRDAGFGRRFNL